MVYKRNFKYLSTALGLGKLGYDMYTRGAGTRQYQGNHNPSYNSRRAGSSKITMGQVQQQLNTVKRLADQVSAIARGQPVAAQVGQRQQQRGRPSRNMASKMAGFVKKPYKKPISGISKKFRVKGTSKTFEVGGQASGVNTVLMGHGTHPAETARLMVWRALIRDLVAKLGVDVRDQNDSMQGDIQVRIAWKIGQGTTTTTFIGFTSGWSFVDILNWATDPARGYSVALASADVDRVAFEFMEILHRTDIGGSAVSTGGARINLQHYLVQVYSKSTMKIQNRTDVGDPEVEAEALDVNNCPLNGKSYEGKGNGVIWKKNNIPVMCDPNTGVFIELGDVIDKQFFEPPRAIEFNYVKHEGKVRFNPGYLKTSSMEHTESHYFDKWMHLIYPSSTALYTKKPIGKYRFFVLEKMIHAYSTEQNIVCAWEHNFYMCAKGTAKATKVMVDNFSAVRDVNVPPPP